MTRRIADGDIDVAPDKPGQISVPVTWGRYRLEVTTNDAQGPETLYSFDSGWYADASADTPDLLEIALDKPEYKPGDTMTVAVTARSAGKVTLAVVSDKLVATTTTDVEAGLAKLPLTVGEDWGTGAYVVATLRRPLEQEAKRMPGRSIGVQWFSIDRAAHTLGIAMDLPDLIRPETKLTVPIKVAGLTPGEEARIVVSAVDVGILNLTNYQPPAPDDYYLGQRKLSTEIRDLYGQLIDGMQGTRGEIRMGGDGGGGELRGSPPTQKPLALYSGIVTVAADGTAQVSFDIPGFVGTARVMAVAWSKEKLGHASRRRDRARSCRRHGDLAALPAHRRQEHASPRARQCRGRDGRLSHRGQDARSGQCRRRRQDREARRQEAERGQPPRHRFGHRRRHCERRGRRTRRFRHRAALCAQCAAVDASSGAEDGEAAQSRPVADVDIRCL